MAFGASCSASLSGCIKSLNKSKIDNRDNEDEISNGPPTGGRKKLLEYSRDELFKMQISGGVTKDGIPSIDNPIFGERSDYEEETFDDNIVFGVKMNGVAKAYPRNILSRHEIVNDSFADENVSITYCPLTGTAIGFKRGTTTFGVSGNLINNNLVMYDRATDSRWPQMLGTAIAGSLKGEFLQEFRVIWTTWNKWTNKHPNTKVLTTDTGYLKNYSSGSYGSYQPRSGYYELDSAPLTQSLSMDNSYPNKSEFIIGRTKDNAYAVRKKFLREQNIVEFDESVALYDKRLDTGYIYNNTGEKSIERSNGEIRVGNNSYKPHNLPAESIPSYNAMWFALDGYYPSSSVKS